MTEAKKVTEVRVDRDDYVDIGLAAEILGLRRNMVARMFDDGELTGRRVGVQKKRQVSKASLEAMLRAWGIPVSRMG